VSELDAENNKRLLDTSRLLINIAADASIPELPKSPSRLRRAVGFASLAAFSFLASYFLPFGQFAYAMSSPPPTDEQTLGLYKPTDDASREVEDYINTHPLTLQLRADPAFTESRPHLKIPKVMRERNLTAGTLTGPNKILVPPFFWAEEGGKSSVSIFYLGSDLSGHQGIVHGGMLATLLDEGLARCCFPCLPNGVGVTANLNIDYRKPVPACQYAVLRARTVKVEGRKAWVEGHIESLPKNGEEPVVMVEAKALFIEPAFAKVSSLNPSICSLSG
jgi:acyl-coenzyme A thioesterase PaaI-like protein